MVRRILTALLALMLLIAPCAAWAGTPETMSVTVFVVWSGGPAPDKINIQLYNEDDDVVPLKTETALPADGWKVEFKDLRKYAFSGEEIGYWVAEADDENNRLVWNFDPLIPSHEMTYRGKKYRVTFQTADTAEGKTVTVNNELIKTVPADTPAPAMPAPVKTAAPIAKSAPKTGDAGLLGPAALMALSLCAAFVLLRRRGA